MYIFIFFIISSNLLLIKIILSIIFITSLIFSILIRSLTILTLLIWKIFRWLRDNKSVAYWFSAIFTILNTCQMPSLKKIQINETKYEICAWKIRTVCGLGFYSRKCFLEIGLQRERSNTMRILYLLHNSRHLARVMLWSISEAAGPTWILGSLCLLLVLLVYIDFKLIVSRKVHLYVDKWLEFV